MEAHRKHLRNTAVQYRSPGEVGGGGVGAVGVGGWKKIPLVGPGGLGCKYRGTKGLFGQRRRSHVDHDNTNRRALLNSRQPQ